MARGRLLYLATQHGADQPTSLASTTAYGRDDSAYRGLAWIFFFVLVFFSSRSRWQAMVHHPEPALQPHRALHPLATSHCLQ